MNQVRPNIVFFDTETTGLPKDYNDFKHPDTPKLVELAAILTDNKGDVIQELHRIIRPNGYEIPVQASNIHGITTERALKEGVPLWYAMWEFEKLCSNAGRLIAHNRKYDDLIVRGSHYRLKMPHVFDSMKQVCTMEIATPICAVPHANGRGIKWPKLSEAIMHFFNEELEGSHGAQVDTNACRRIYFEFIRLGHIEAPELA